ncbi:lipid carrier--UDP-N-acetylgalactosaminyltransferase [Rhizobium sp. R72]|uniref:sugar transferase n=1 Tax=unclassified Rhizobium TaxID=2613769 RepID=UPI000B535730|nr:MULTISPECIES: sugar transferase [unclassified Rhizobium]OWW04821.1 lipid carrier--UDP-N-acetylgalactosaminyltransferase [Rhizobium sp. R72]OWW05878.1 lipid carrier--UDP-N-acetylgalactosaminyltransferase [Rhizobium sp. R711]
MLYGFNRFLKRLFDICAAGLGLVVLSPVFIVLVFLVRKSSPGGALFLQERVGRSEVPFVCIKFRTMAAGSPNVGSHDAASSWITPLGRKLRTYKLDELPQLINVLRGDMSFVGPRPCLPSQHDVIAARRKRQVFSVRPGITGLAQLQGIDMSTPEALAEADARYIQKAGFWQDVILVLGTLAGRGTGDAAAK